MQQYLNCHGLDRSITSENISQLPFSYFQHKSSIVVIVQNCSFKRVDVKSNWAANAITHSKYLLNITNENVNNACILIKFIRHLIAIARSLILSEGKDKLLLTKTLNTKGSSNWYNKKNPLQTISTSIHELIFTEIEQQWWQGVALLNFDQNVEL